MLKGPVKRLLIQRSSLKTQRAEARRTRASGQVGCLRLPAPSEVCPGVGLRGRGADTALTAQKNCWPLRAGEGFCFCLFEGSPSFPFYHVVLRNFWGLVFAFVFKYPPSHLVHWASRRPALCQGLPWYWGHTSSAAHPHCFTLDVILPPFEVQAPIPSPPKLDRGLCRGALDWGPLNLLGSQRWRVGFVLHLGTRAGSAYSLCPTWPPGEHPCPGVHAPRGETGSAARREEVKAEDMEGVMGELAMWGEERGRLSWCCISVLREREAKTKKTTYIFRFCFWGGAKSFLRGLIRTDKSPQNHHSNWRKWYDKQ